jgi:hypothetical protein
MKAKVAKSKTSTVATKLMIMTLAVCGLTAQDALANRGGRETRPEAVRGRETEAARADAARTARGAEGAGRVAELVRNLNVGRLSPAKSRDLQTAMANNAEVRQAIEQIIGQQGNRDLAELNAARVEALANMREVRTDVTAEALAAMDPVRQAEQAYLTLATSGGNKATTWSTDLRSNLSFLLARSNELVAQGRSMGEALIEANRDLAREKGVSLRIEDINKYCR